MTSELDPGHRLPQEPVEPEPPTPPRRGDGDGDGDGIGEPDPTRLLWLVVGAAAIAGGTALGWDATALSSVVTPPPAIRALLVGSSFALGIVLLLSAVGRLSGFAEEPLSVRSTVERDIAGMIRGVRLVFLAVAAFAASSGWALGHPLPLVVALVIAGVDVLETSFLLVVVGLRRRR
ncbi:MAG TPA: hypothetical protein VFR93_09710 [Candidatus Limnocylindrales bacterium]|jgi:hypothetical protein|nr:hypothetical protein [Candidatus Limnocylindrales bacterium]